MNSDACILYRGINNNRNVQITQKKKTKYKKTTNSLDHWGKSGRRSARKTKIQLLDNNNNNNRIGCSLIREKNIYGINTYKYALSHRIMINTDTCNNKMQHTGYYCEKENRWMWNDNNIRKNSFRISSIISSSWMHTVFRMYLIFHAINFSRAHNYVFDAIHECEPIENTNVPLHVCAKHTD